jgi:hypothetical protein
MLELPTSPKLVETCPKSHAQMMHKIVSPSLRS